MENNNYILGKIPCSGGGICKTYEESIFYWRYHMEDHIYDKVYMGQNGKPYIGRKESPEDKELVVLRIYPYGVQQNAFLLELIDKDILHAHLYDEREIIERLIESGQNTLTLK